MMEAKEFRKVGKELIDFIADHIENIDLYPVTPNVKPGEISSAVLCICLHAFLFLTLRVSELTILKLAILRDCETPRL